MHYRIHHFEEITSPEINAILMEQMKKLFKEMPRRKNNKFNEEMFKKHEASLMNLISGNLISKSLGSTLLKN